MIRRRADATRIRVIAPDAGSPARFGEPVTLGVPVPSAAATGPWSLRDTSGRTIPVQITRQPTAPRAATAWLLVDFLADVPPGGLADYQLIADESSHEANGMRVDQPASGAIVVHAGTAAFVVPGSGGVMFSARPRGDATVPISVWITDARDQRSAVEFSNPRIELGGPLRTVVRLDGVVVVDAVPLRFTARIHFLARPAVARVELSLTNPRRAQHPGGHWDLGDAGSVHFRDVSVVCTPPAPIDAASCSIDCERAPESFSVPLEIYQDSSGGENWRSPVHVNRSGQIPVSFQGYRVVSAGTETRGRRASPVLCARCGDEQIALAVPHFWQNFPKAIDVDATSLTLRLFPGQFDDLHELQGGERKTHVFVMCFGPDTVTPEDPLAWARSPVVASASSEAYSAAGLWRPLGVGADAARRAYNRLVDGAIEGESSFVRKREQVDEYGWRHFGDLYADHEAAGHAGFVSHYNNQYDAVEGFATRFFESGDLRWWSMLCDLAEHVVDVDIYHCEGDKAAYRGGMFWHTSHYVDAGRSTHRSFPSGSGSGGGPSNEHNYTSGLLLHYRLTGSERSREAVIGLGDWVLRMDDGAQTPFWWLVPGETGLASATRDPDFHGPGRGAAYSINALLDAHDLTGNPRYLAKVERLIRRCIHPADDPEQLELLDAERRWSYTVFLQVLGKYLEYRHADGDADPLIDYARLALVNYATWMMTHDAPYLSRAEQLEYPTETWAAQDIRKAAVLEFAARHAPADRRETFLTAAASFFDESVRTLDDMPTRSLTRPVVLLLAYGFQRPMSDAATPLVDLCIARFGPSQTNRFVPYKRRVIQRLSGLAAIAATAIVVLISLLLK